MATMVFAPGVRVYIESIRHGVIDVTEDIERGTLNLTENAPSHLRLTLLNHKRKYDGAFAPNDRIAVQMKRIRWVQVFAGYLGAVPFYSMYPRSIELTAMCSLKRLKYRLWDPGLAASVELLSSLSGGVDDYHKSDGGIATRLKRLLVEVGEWPSSHIHIGEIPFDWFESVSGLYARVSQQLSTMAAGVGTGSTMAGTNPLLGAPTQIKDAPPGAGVLPATVGRISAFGGPGGGAYGSMALTGESGVNPLDPWYCAMRWPYVLTSPTTGQAVRNPDFTNEDRIRAMNWWKGRKILVVNPKTNKAVVLRAADWGPAGTTHRVIDVSPHALHTVLMGKTDDTVEIRFAQQDAPLGPANIASTTLDSAGVQPINNAWVIPQGITTVSANQMAWGGYENGKIPANSLREVTSPDGTKVLLHPQAAMSYAAMRDAALKEGIKISIGGGYRSYSAQVATKAAKGNLAATPGNSNHGWGLAADFAHPVNNYASAEHLWLVRNGARFGWVLPPWAQQKGSKPEPWHWEFWAGLNFTNAAAGSPQRSLELSLQGVPVGAAGLTQVTIMGATASVASSAGGGSLPAGSTGTDSLLNTWQATDAAMLDPVSQQLTGPRALMNDVPLLPTVQKICQSAQRSFMAAPNGDFIAWFPDYFDQHGITGKMVVREIEMTGDGFTIMWSDDSLVTHQYVVGAQRGGGTLVNPGGPVTPTEMMGTMGIASIDFPELMQTLFNLATGDERSQFWLAPDVLYKRFGARVAYEEMPTINDRTAEFFFAVYRFMQGWSSQFSAEVNLSFMPEVWPGMHLQFPSFGLQVYATSVTHSFNFETGFDTSVTITAPSAMGKQGLYALPRAG